MTTTRQAIAAATKVRGYRQQPGANDAMLQWLKTLDEISELALEVGYIGVGPDADKVGYLDAIIYAHHAGVKARTLFDAGTALGLSATDKVAGKMADVFVCLMNLADALGIDLADEALRKVGADATRGRHDGGVLFAPQDGD